MTGELDYVLRGVRARRGEEGRHDVIDGVAAVIGEFGELRLPRSPIDGRAQDRVGDVPGARAGQAYDA
jgi:hypothetical protein